MLNDDGDALACSASRPDLSLATVLVSYYLLLPHKEYYAQTWGKGVNLRQFHNMTFALPPAPCVLRVGLKPEAFLGLLRGLEDDDASFVNLYIFGFLAELERSNEFQLAARPAVAGYLLVLRQICLQYEHITPTPATWEEDAVLFQMASGLCSRARIRVWFHAAIASLDARR